MRQKYTYTPQQLTDMEAVYNQRRERERYLKARGVKPPPDWVPAIGSFAHDDPEAHFGTKNKSGAFDKSAKA